VSNAYKADFRPLVQLDKLDPVVCLIDIAHGAEHHKGEANCLSFVTVCRPTNPGFNNRTVVDLGFVSSPQAKIAWVNCSLSQGVSRMFGNTLVLPQVGGNITLVKINQDAYTSEYMFRTALTQYNAKIRHSKVKVGGVEYDRHNFEVVQTIFATSTVAEYKRKFYYVYEHLPSDTSVDLGDAVADLAIATSDAFMVSLFGWES
jgi:hypothetical protein